MKHAAMQFSEIQFRDYPSVELSYAISAIDVLIKTIKEKNSHIKLLI